MESKDILLSLVEEIQYVYTNTEEEWEQFAAANDLFLFNQKSVRVLECQGDPQCLNLITKYLVFLTSRKIDESFHRIGDNYVLDSRIKSRNSVEEKLSVYSGTGENFNVNKCLNDLFGIRIIIDDDLSFDSIFNLFRDNKDVKCIDSSKPKHSNPKDYTATHIYFRSKGNTHFQWELQIWRTKDEVQNQKSHKGHRFRYTTWEKVRK